MIEIRCPNCDRLGLVPHLGTNMALVCKKCGEPFYMDESGAAVLGVPPSAFDPPPRAPGPLESRVPSVDEVERMGERLKERVQELPVGRILAIAAAVVVGLVALWSLLRPSDKLDKVAAKAAPAMVGDDPARLRSYAAPGTADDLGRWFEEVRPRVAQARTRWHDKEPVVEIHVGEENHGDRTWPVVASYRPAGGTARDVSLANPVEALASAVPPLDLETAWTRSKWGGWKLDGKATLAKLHPPR